MAMSMAIHHCKPCQKPMRLLFVPSYRGKLRVNMAGELLVAGQKKKVELIHFATPNTELFLYRYLNDLIKGTASLGSFCRIWLQCVPKEMKAALRHSGGQVLRRLLPASAVARLRKKF